MNDSYDRLKSFNIKVYEMLKNIFGSFWQLEKKWAKKIRLKR